MERRLVLSCGLDARRSRARSAANIAGGRLPRIEPDAAALKRPHATEPATSSVNTLDEALRTLKNEVRKGRPLSVGLTRRHAAVLAEMLERGVLPDARSGLEFGGCWRRERSSGLNCGRWARRLATSTAEGRSRTAIDADALLDQETQRHGWRLHCLGVEDRAASLDARSALGTGDAGGHAAYALAAAGAALFPRERHSTGADLAQRSRSVIAGADGLIRDGEQPRP